MNVALFAERCKSVDESKRMLAPLVDKSVKWQCSFCNHTFFFGQLGEGTLIEVKCPICKKTTPIGVPISA
jgi:phage FluMu protein Com